ncbi:hypothetical protein ACWD0J_38365 [Streptomyces sp. NPDC003011]
MRGKQFALLSSSVTEDVPLADVLTDRRSPEAVLFSDRFADPRIDAVLRQMQVAEERLAIEWAHSKDNWRQVAAEAGRPTAYGERICCKLTRLGRPAQRASRRSALQSETGGGMTLSGLLLILLLVVVTLLVGAGVLALLLYRPTWAAPLAGALTAMMLMATVTGLLVAVTSN